VTTSAYCQAAWWHSSTTLSCMLYTAVRHNAAIATFDDTLAKRAKNIGLTVAAAAG
jgi:rRNA-processing protein FCF1